MHSTRISAALLVALAVACGGGGKAKPVTPTPTDTVAVTPTDAKPPADKAADPGPTAEEALTWVLAAVDSGQVTKADVEARFAPSFLKAVPADQVVAIMGQLHGQLPPVKILKQEGTAPKSTSVLLQTASGGVRIDLEMTATEPRQIAGLLFKPATAEAPPKTYGDAVAQLEKAGAKQLLFIASVDAKGKCAPLQNHNTTAPIALGSTFKLWVLLALDEKLHADKKLSWDTKLAIRDEAKSLPSGTMQDEAAGTEHTLREFATQMISISDNTATDHLIDYVGDAAVEKALKLAKHGNPASNIPFLRTREMFGLKLAATDDERAAYKKAKLADKRKMLADFRKRPIDLDKAIADWKTPRDLDLEWFADGRDLCAVLGALGSRGKFDPKSDLLQVLSKNPGVPYDKAKWTYVGFKGGSEPGVMTLTWLLQRADGKWFVVAMGVNDPTHELDEGLVANAGAGTLQILADEMPATK